MCKITLFRDSGFIMARSLMAVSTTCAFSIAVNPLYGVLRAPAQFFSSSAPVSNNWRGLTAGVASGWLSCDSSAGGDLDGAHGVRGACVPFPCGVKYRLLSWNLTCWKFFYFWRCLKRGHSLLHHGHEVLCAHRHHHHHHHHGRVHATRCTWHAHGTNRHAGRGAGGSFWMKWDNGVRSLRLRRPPQIHLAPSSQSMPLFHTTHSGTHETLFQLGRQVRRVIREFGDVWHRQWLAFPAQGDNSFQLL